MVNTIYGEDSIREAAGIIQNHPLILIVGDQVNPVPIDDFLSLRTKVYSGTDRLLPPEQTDPLLFRQYEKIRLRTSNLLPHYNYVCLLRLIRTRPVRAVITTNFDNYLNSVLFRYGGNSLKGIMNPCIRTRNGVAREWCCDGYYSPLPSSANGVPIWKIHGDLGFARMIDCAHVFALPKFMIESPRVKRLQPDEPGCCHFIVLQADGSRFKGAPSLSREHPALRYKHHIDFGVSRGNFFLREREAAREQLLQHCHQGGGVFIIGMAFNPDFGEDLTDILLDLPTRTPIIYLVASKERRIEEGDSELLDDLTYGHRSPTLINEVTRTGAIDNGLVKLLAEIGETGIDEEYRRWRKEGKWWQKLGK